MYEQQAFMAMINDHSVWFIAWSMIMAYDQQGIIVWSTVIIYDQQIFSHKKGVGFDFLHILQQKESLKRLFIAEKCVEIQNPPPFMRKNLLIMYDNCWSYYERLLIIRYDQWSCYDTLLIMHDDMLITAMKTLLIIHDVWHIHVIMKVIVTTRI